MIRCLLVLSVAVSYTTLAQGVPPVTCPSGYHRAGHRCYLFSQKQMTWPAAVDFCEAQGANLAAMETEAEYNLLRGLTMHEVPKLPPMKLGPYHGDSKQFWLGGYYSGVRKQYFWHNSSPTPFHKAISYWNSADIKGDKTVTTSCMYWTDKPIARMYDCKHPFFGALCEHESVPPASQG